ncbi:hypothetical protein [Paenibacillus sp. cl141a]|uniref:hypothetical protein n=1 Tax=Paenibacillus sp. cl141a TaxID=1761877 RepID=UPI000B899566|nr:hypothetical protein [Paenibacillus sp. cl141a]
MGIIASKPARLPLSPDFYFGRMGEWKSGNNCDQNGNVGYSQGDKGMQPGSAGAKFKRGWDYT